MSAMLPGNRMRGQRPMSCWPKSWRCLYGYPERRNSFLGSPISTSLQHHGFAVASMVIPLIVFAGECMQGRRRYSVCVCHADTGCCSFDRHCPLLVQSCCLLATFSAAGRCRLEDAIGARPNRRASRNICLCNEVGARPSAWAATAHWWKGGCRDATS